MRSTTILVVEDDSIILGLIAAVLKKSGFRILTAQDGIEGSVAFAREFNSIDLVLTDLALPGMRGDDLARYARKLRPDIKLMIASGSVRVEDFNLVAEFLGCKFLPKPFTSEELLAAVRTILGEQPAQQRPSERAASKPVV